METWVLIMWMAGYKYGTAIHSTEFSSKQTCQIAQQQFAPQGSMYSRAFCVKK